MVAEGLTHKECCIDDGGGQWGKRDERIESPIVWDETAMSWMTKT